MKKIGLCLGILVIILIGAILIVPSFLNWNEYKDQIEKTASDFTGRRVMINGDISLSLLPTSALSVKDVLVKNLDGGQAEYMLSLKSLDIKVSFPSVISSLFGGQVKVEKFILVDPVIALEALPDGRVNWELNAGKSGEPAQSFSADISLDKFQIVNGQVSFEDMSAQQMELLRKINVNLKVNSINGPFEVSGSAKYKGLDADLSFSIGKLRPGKKVPVKLVMSMLDDQVNTSVIGGMILSGKDSSFSGKLNVKTGDGGDLFNIIDRFNGRQSPSTIKIGQDFSIDTAVVAAADKIAVKDLNIRLGNSRGQGSVEILLSKKTDKKINILANLSVNKLDIDPFLIAYSEQQKQHESLKKNSGDGDKESQEDSGNILNRLSGKLGIKLGALKYNDKIASQIAVKLQAIDGVVNISTIQVRMPGGSGLNFKGLIENQQDGKRVLSGDISLNASNLRGLLSWLKVDVSDIPSGKLAQFSYKSGIKVSSDLLQFYGMSGNLDTLSFKGGVSYALAGRPSYGISLDVRNLNLDSYLSERKSDKKNDLKKSLTLLDEFDAKYDLALSNFTVNGLKINSGKLDGLLLGGKLEVKEMTLADMAGINVKASGQGINFNSNPEFSIQLSANAKTLATLQRSLKREDSFDLRKLGDVILDGTITTTLEKMDMDLSAKLGIAKVNAKGTLRSATLKQFPEIGSADLNIYGSSASLVALIDQFDLPIARPMAKDDRTVAIRGRLKASSDFVDFDGKFNVADGEIIVKGRRKGAGKITSLDVALDMKAPDTRDFIRGLGIDFKPNAQKLGPIALKMKLNGSGDQYSFNNIVGDVGPVKFSGAGKLNMVNAKPYFDIILKAGEIPLHDFLAQNSKKKSEDGNIAYGQWTREDMDLSLLSDYDGRAQISASSLRYQGYVFENPTFEIILKDGIISINDFNGRLFGGVVAMSGTFGGKGKPQMDLTMTVKKASLAQATFSAAGIKPVTGFFDMSGKFTGEGNSQYDLISSLVGNGEIIADSGLVYGIDIPELSNQLSEMNDKNSFLNLLGATLSGGETSYNGWGSAIVIKDGKLQLAPFDILLDGAQSNVKMAIDLVKWDIRSQGSLSLIDHPSAPPIGVSISGNVSNPDVVYKTDLLKKYVGAKIAANVFQQLIGEEGGIKDIFGDQGKQPVPESVKPAEDKKEQTPPEDAEKSVEDFGKRMLQKLFEKQPNAE